MRISCIALDDEPPALGLLREYISRTPFLDLRGAFYSPLAALEAIQANPPALVFLDVNMPDMTGMQLSRLLPESTRVIFTTAYESYALESYRVTALDYLLKPFNYPEFLEAAEKALDYYTLLRGQTPKENFMFVKADYKLHKLMFDDILYVENIKDYVRFHRRSGQRLMSLMTLKAVEEALPGNFMKVHRSFIVNLHAIEVIEQGQIQVSGREIPVASRYKEEFKRYISSHQAGG